MIEHDMYILTELASNRKLIPFHPKNCYRTIVTIIIRDINTYKVIINEPADICVLNSGEKKIYGKRRTRI